jgi:hypothetical protein
MKLSLFHYVLGLFIVSGIATYITYSKLNTMHEQELAELINDNDTLMFNLAATNKELNSYLVTEDSLIKLGASKQQAQSIIQASEAHHISPKF